MLEICWEEVALVAISKNRSHHLNSVEKPQETQAPPKAPPEPPPQKVEAPSEPPPQKPAPGAAVAKRHSLDRTANALKQQAEEKMERKPPSQAQIESFVENRIEANQKDGGENFQRESEALQGITQRLEQGKLTPAQAWQQVKFVGKQTDEAQAQKTHAEVKRAEEVEGMNPLQRAGEFWKGFGGAAVDTVKGIGEIAQDVQQMNPVTGAGKFIGESTANFVKTGDLKSSVQNAFDHQVQETQQAAARNFERGQALAQTAWTLGPKGLVNNATESFNIAKDTVSLAQEGRLSTETFMNSVDKHGDNNPTKQMLERIGKSFVNDDRLGGATDPKNIGRTAFNVFTTLAPTTKGIAPKWLKPKLSVSPLRSPVQIAPQRALPPASSPPRPGGWRTIDVDAVTVGAPTSVPKPTVSTLAPRPNAGALSSQAPQTAVPSAVSAAPLAQAQKPGGISDPDKFINTWNRLMNPHNCTYGNCETLADEVVHHLNTGRPSPESLSPVLRNPAPTQPRFESQLIDGVTDITTKTNRGDVLIERLDKLVASGRSYELAIYEANANNLYANMEDHAIAVTLGPDGKIIGLDPQNALVLQRHDLIDVINNASTTEVHDVLGPAR